MVRKGPHSLNLASRVYSWPPGIDRFDSLVGGQKPVLEEISLALKEKSDSVSTLSLASEAIGQQLQWEQNVVGTRGQNCRPAGASAMIVLQHHPALE